MATSDLDRNPVTQAALWQPAQELLDKFPQFTGGSIGVHPANLSGHVSKVDPARMPATKSAFETAVNASAKIYHSSAVLSDARLELSGYDLKNQGATAQRWNENVALHDKAASRAHNAAVAAAAAAEESLAKTSTDLETKIKSTLQIPLPPHVQTEIRSVLRSAKSPKEELRKLVSSKDLAGLSAVLQAPAFVSGVTDEDVNTYAEMAAQHHAPDLTLQRDAVAGLRQALANNLAIVSSAYQENQHYAKPVISNRPAGYSETPRIKAKK